METLCYFPSCVSVSSCKLSLTHHHQLLQPRRDPHPPLRHFHIRASATKKSRRSRKLKSDAELCNDIREFVAAVGLPQDHVPSTKELLQHGRNDLANIVRRRGYKLMQELLTSSLSSDVDVSNTDKILDERLDGADDCKDLFSGQNVKVDTIVDDVTASTAISQGNNYSCLNTDSTPNIDDHTCISIESSANSCVEENDLTVLKHHADEVNYMAEGYCYSTQASIVNDDCSTSRKGPDPYFDNQSSIVAEISGESSVEEKSSQNLECSDNMEWSKLEGPDDSNNNIAENVPWSIQDSIMENLSGGTKFDSVVHSADNSFINVDSSTNLSLEEKVAKFIQSGDLDPVEDHVFGILNGNGSEESEVHVESEPVVEMPHNAEHSKHPPKDNTAMALSGSSLTSKQVVSSATIDCLLWDDHLPDEDQTARLDKDLDAESIKRQDQSEINNLKFMLYQKELELSQLKEQIEKEKLELSALQTKAEAEINKARKLISEKDAELNVAEESLSGLKEVQIEFCGDADTVEVAGSFNGWHHRIKLDPKPSKSVIDPPTSRRSRLWSTVLWLYPGVYEIKFVVDGHWTTDPGRESLTRGHICNNILRVDR